ncbi:MAG: ParB N-terminal domain-containing protein [Anaerolineae bacterium]|nr:ParB N-terminal domain-containing protein [Anaerolineae bacterium]MDW8171570.1 ParB N-terminal domain-containing protein [Anaerolineae bacterium]
MAKRRRDRGSSGEEDLINQLDSVSSSEDNVTLSAIASEGYRSQVEVFPELSRQRIKVLQIPIEQISPSITQPRRVIPTQIRQYWDGKSTFESVGYMYKKWLYEIMLEKGGTYLDLDAHLQGNVTDRAPLNIEETLDNETEPTRLGALTSSFMQIVDLASSIKRDGLTNPITIASGNSAYIIETGERRWWAYHLLYWHFQSDEWQKIPARVVDKVSLWRQASENNARSSLNAIAKARQFALLLMALYEEEGVSFLPLHDLDHEQSFYAQVADGDQWRIPRGKGETLLNAMGLENPVQLRQYRRLLRLPRLVWMLADDLGWTENLLRQRILSSGGTEKDIIQAALFQASKDGYTVNDLTVYAPYIELPEIAYDGYHNPSRKVLRDDADLAIELRWLLKNAGRIRLMDKSEIEEVLVRIDAIRAWLNEVEALTKDRDDA